MRHTAQPLSDASCDIAAHGITNGGKSPLAQTTNLRYTGSLMADVDEDTQALREALVRLPAVQRAILSAYVFSLLSDETRELRPSAAPSRALRRPEA